MKIQLHKPDADLQVLQLQGDLDFHSSPDLRRELTKLVDQQRMKILINLKEVSYIDSSGLATFVELFQKMKRYGGKLALYHLNTGVRSVFEIAKLNTIFKLADSEDQAKTFVS